MDFNRNSNGAFINPCAKRSAAEASESNDLAYGVAINTIVNDFNMIIQSQLCNGAFKKLKKMATKAKTKRVYKQKAIGGSVAFKEALHCSICKAQHLSGQGKNVNIPHRPHHKKCSKNRKTKELSAMTVFVNKEATRNMAMNITAPVASFLGQKVAAEAGTNIENSFSPYTQLNPPDTNAAQLPLGMDDVVAWSKQQGRNLQKFEPKSPSSHEVIDNTLGNMNQDQEFKWLEKTKYLKAITLAIDYIVAKFEHRKS
jgi:hypothetical protein